MRQGPPPELRGIQESTKPHKFFERHLNNDLDLLANGLGVLLPPFLAGFFELELSLFEELLPVFFVFITSRISPQRYSKYNQLVKDKMHLLYVR